MIRFLSILICLFSISFCHAQFPGAAGTVGSTAIHQDSDMFIGWGSGCEVQPGYLDIANPALGFVNNGTPQSCIGKPSLNVLSLGDSGIATVTFDAPIYDGEGFDFAVFENAFSDYFLELAFVEVSSDGANFVRFPSTSYQQDTLQQGPYDEISDPTKINNLAGKYRAQYGTPFDLSEIADSSEVDISNITHIRVVDAIGSLDPDYRQTDATGNAINDPYPTDFDFGGFDLNAIGVIYQHPLSVAETNNISIPHLPNPLHCSSIVQIFDSEINEIMIIDMLGRMNSIQINNQSFTTPSTPGNYILRSKKTNRFSDQKIVLLP